MRDKPRSRWRSSAATRRRHRTGHSAGSAPQARAGACRTLCATTVARSPRLRVRQARRRRTPWPRLPAERCRATARPSETREWRNACSAPAAFEIRGLDLVLVHQLAPGSAQRYQAIDHDIRTVRQFERVECILLHQEDAEPLLAIKSLDGPEYLTRDERRQPQRRLIQEQQPRAPHQVAGDGQHLLLAAGEGAAALVDTLLEPWKQLKHAFQVGLKKIGICQAGADLQG